MKLPVRLALRYLVKRRTGTLVHLISSISVVVIAAVAAAMIAILSAFNGIEDLVQTLFGTLDAEVAILPQSGAVLPEELGDVLEGIPGVEAWAAVVEDECVLRANESVRVATLLGVDGAYRKVSGIQRSVVEGAYRVDDSTQTCACLGLGVRSELALRADSVAPPILSMSAPMRGKRLARHRERAFRTLPLAACGTFSINADLDTRYALVPLSTAQELLDRDGMVSRWEVRAAHGWTEEEVAQSVREALAMSSLPGADNAWVQTRSDKHRFITQTNQGEKWATFAILSFILVVAAFNIMASLTMLLLDKQRDLEVLQAMGMPDSAIQAAFAWQGLAINVVGGLVGVVAGALIVLGQAQYGWLTLQGSVVPSYPVRLAAPDVAGTLLVVVVIGGLGSAGMVRHLIKRHAQRGLQSNA
jgi:ABC-type lipoprotein release transport system permease subunit